MEDAHIRDYIKRQIGCILVKIMSGRLNHQFGKKERENSMMLK